MIVVSPTHFTLPPAELHIGGAGRNVTRAKILRSSRLYYISSHSFNQITLLFIFPGLLICWINLRPISLTFPVL